MRFRRAARPDYLAAMLFVGGWLTTVALPIWAAAQRPAAAAKQTSKPPMVIDAGYSHVDYNTNTVVFRDVVVSQGDTRVMAERAHASGVGFENSEWTFEGNVQMVLQPRGTLSSDRAVVQFKNGRITQATATGRPARFEQPPSESRRAAYGSAEEILYDAAADSVRLSGSARLSDGRAVEVSGPLLLYDAREERLQAPSSGKGRVHITVKPRAQPE
jgi:lipopolysaccharide transport protein LptA